MRGVLLLLLLLLHPCWALFTPWLLSWAALWVFDAFPWYCWLCDTSLLEAVLHSGRISLFDLFCNGYSFTPIRPVLWPNQYAGLEEYCGGDILFCIHTSFCRIFIKMGQNLKKKEKEKFFFFSPFLFFCFPVFDFVTFVSFFFLLVSPSLILLLFSSLFRKSDKPEPLGGSLPIHTLLFLCLVQPHPTFRFPFVFLIDFFLAHAVHLTW